MGLEYDIKALLGKGASGRVFLGSFNGKPVAVKRILLEDAEQQKPSEREKEILFTLDHPNVIKLFHLEDRDPFKLFALELCSASLDRLFLSEDDPEKFRGLMPPDRQVLLQIAKGLNHIHLKGFVHRDVKPENILIYEGNPGQYCLIKLSDFGLSKAVSIRGTFSQSGTTGTLHWMAPECLQQLNTNAKELPRGSIQSDIFSSGCTFGYYATKGKHPFGDNFDIAMNIINGKHVNLKKGNIKDHLVYDLVFGMVRAIPEDRTKVDDVIQILERAAACLPSIGTVVDKFKLSLEMRNIPVSSFNPVRPLLACASAGTPAKISIFEGVKQSSPIESWEEKQVWEMKTERSDIRRLEWSVDGKKLAAIIEESLRVFDLNGNILIATDGQAKLVAIYWNPFDSELLATSDNKGVVVISSTSLAVGETEVHTTSTRTGGFSWISTNEFISSSDDGGIHWRRFSRNVEKSEEISMIKCHLAWGPSILWHSFSGMVASRSSPDGKVQVWYLDSKEPVREPELSSPCHCIAWSPVNTEDPVLACGMQDGSVVIFNVKNRREGPECNEDHFILRGHSDPVKGLVFSPNGLFLASISANGTVIVRNIQEDGHHQMFLWDSSKYVPCSRINWHPSGRKLIFHLLQGVDQILQAWEYTAE